MFPTLNGCTGCRSVLLGEVITSIEREGRLPGRICSHDLFQGYSLAVGDLDPRKNNGPSENKAVNPVENTTVSWEQ